MLRISVVQNFLLVVASTSLLAGAARADVSSVASPPAPRAAAGPAALHEAPPPPDDPDGYRELVRDAVLEYDRGNFEEARALFTRAHERFPNARTHRGIGKAEFELRNYEAAVGHLQAALRSDVRPLTADLRAETEQLLSRAQDYFGGVLIETRPAASEIRVDGTPVVYSPGQPLPVRIGERVLELDAPGFVSERRVVSVKGGAPERLFVVFGRPIATHDKEARGRHWYASPWLWTAVGVVVAGAATGAVVAATRGGEKTGSYDLGNSGILGKAP